MRSMAIRDILWLLEIVLYRNIKNIKYKNLKIVKNLLIDYLYRDSPIIYVQSVLNDAN